MIIENEVSVEDYAYDVLVSYTRAHPVGTWVKDRLLRDFIGYLAEELGRRPKVFFDQHDIQPGDNWVAKIDIAIKKSRVLVAVCSARYFYDSEYCRREWYSFGELDVGGKKLYRPRVPIRYNDGKTFPVEARETQQADFSGCNYLIEAFYKNDVRAVTYEDNVRALAIAVVSAIENAPPYTTQFSVMQPPDRCAGPLNQPRL